MSPQPETCPGCGARVHPQDLHCRRCGTALNAPPPRSRVLPVLVGVAGVLVALAAGAGVWVLMSPPHAQQQAAAPQPAAPPPAAPVEPAPAPPAPTPVPPAADQQAAAPAPEPAAQQPLQPLPPGALQPLPEVPSDPDSRREFAKGRQDSFKENGLDISVSATGDEARVMTLKFNFPARTAVDLIAGGPFPRQCKARGFTTIVFQDPNGTSWTYDLATDNLTQTDAKAP
ncbi:hypothetical protein ACLBXM_05180 [Xanthobacteraceae bacterium A53D]